MFVSYEKHDIPDDFNQKCLILYTHGCNLRCPYCFNKHLVLDKKMFSLSENMVFDLLERHKNEYDLVVITGGEPTLHSEIFHYLEKIKSLGYKIELCSNGSNSAIIKILAQENLIDNFRIDFKCPPEKYRKFGFTTLDEYYNVLESIRNVILYNKDKLEVRTTLHQLLITQSDLEIMCDMLLVYELQNYSLLCYDNTNETIGKLPSFDENFYNFSKIENKFSNFRICKTRN